MGVVLPKRRSQVAPSGGDVIPSYPYGAGEENALYRFRSHLEAASDLSGDPALLPLFALPQVAKPWLHPHLSTLLASGSSWVSDLRSSLAHHLSSYLLLARPPALLVLHTAWKHWNRNLKLRCEVLLRRSDHLRNLSLRAVSLGASLVEGISKEQSEEGSRVSLDHFRRSLNALRREWESSGNRELSIGVAPPLDGSRLARFLLAPSQSGSGKVLAAVADRLSWPESTVRDQTADACLTGDIFSLHSTEAKAGLLSRVSSGEVSNAEAVAATLRIIAVLSLRISGRHYLSSATPESWKFLVAALVSSLGLLAGTSGGDGVARSAAVGCASVALTQILINGQSNQKLSVVTILVDTLAALAHSSQHGARSAESPLPQGALIEALAGLLVACCRSPLVEVEMAAAMTGSKSPPSRAILSDLVTLYVKSSRLGSEKGSSPPQWASVLRHTALGCLLLLVEVKLLSL